MDALVILNVCITHMMHKFALGITDCLTIYPVQTKFLQLVMLDMNSLLNILKLNVCTSLSVHGCPWLCASHTMELGAIWSQKIEKTADQQKEIKTAIL